MAWKRREIEGRLRPVTDRELNRWGETASSRPGFAKALRQPDRLAVIAEIKRRSPSAGAIAAEAGAARQAQRYLEAGAGALSVLTDKKYFDGSLDDLREVTAFLDGANRVLPCLRKDFMVHPVQIIEALEAGARAILIIVRALQDDEIARLFDAATAAGLDTLFEVHEEREVERALNAGARVIGVNNRDLARFTTDLAFTEAILPQLPDDIIKVSESGIATSADARRARSAGADAILVGESLMRAEDPAALLESLATAS